MDELHLIKAFASATTVIAALMVASNWSARTMVAGFSVFVAASLAWIVAGLLEDQPSIYVQNVVLLVINLFGIHRWLPRAEPSHLQHNEVQPGETEQADPRR